MSNKATKPNTDDYIEGQAMATRRVVNEDKVCVDCRYRRMHVEGFGETERGGACSKYPIPVFKPDEVMRGGPCPYYEKE